MPVTLKDIAEELNISVNAVSRALRNMPDIGPETTKKVYETARRLGYRKNLAASYLKTAKSMTLGIIVPDVCNPVFSYMYRGIEKVCSRMEYTLMLSNSNENAEIEHSRIDNMIAHGVDGIFIVPSVQSAYYKQLDEANIPYVILQRKSGGKQENFVQSDDFEGGYLAAKHLFELGHRKFLLVFPSPDVSSARDRYNGFLSFLNEQAISDSAVSMLECSSSRESGYEVMRAWLEQQPDHKKPCVDAIFCFSDYVAYGVYTALTHYGLCIPEDISVMGYDNNEYSEMISPTLTTIDILPYDIGKHAARLMLDILQSEQPKSMNNPTKVILSPRLVARDSVKNLV